MLNLPIGSENRWGARVRVEVPVELIQEGRDAMGAFLTNLSLSGAFLRSVHDLRLNTLIGVRIEPPARSADDCVVKAWVSRKTMHGFGIEWREFAPAIVKELLRSPSAVDNSVSRP